MDWIVICGLVGVGAYITLVSQLVAAALWMWLGKDKPFLWVVRRKKFDLSSFQRR